MTNRENQILEEIRKNPLISQKELAEKLGITRSGAAVHISNLIKKGYITGKGYIVRENPYVCVVGGANIDIYGFPFKKLIKNDSNPGAIKLALGGVGRNISENLVKLGIDTNLITVLGDDIYADNITEHSREVGIKIENSLIMKNSNSSTYLSILDENGNMDVAIAAMDIFENMNVEFIKTKDKIIKNSNLCVIDTNIPKETIEYIVKEFSGDTEFLLDTVSTSKAMKIKDIIGYFQIIKPNKIEAEILTGIKIKTDSDLKKAGDIFINKGVKTVIITLGEDGVYYQNEEKSGIFKTKKVKMVNASGAGDAFAAGLAYSHINSLDIYESVKFSAMASIVAISSEETINPKLSVEEIHKIERELER
ncbi:PfkB family carbohydrate kinase [Haliovirga abyssi]|uniref:Carbohydrate kinase n=1 Tax=Haliovirga abyssi TaxID=2996794 RepID=A0AAU9D5W0_9FUSO|nr:PfkB family carbohydrate kinase [Haliovirga abyssi]BDU51446.1 carbohydrate kinase [Haliovirga abyssi]